MTQVIIERPLDGFRGDTSSGTNPCKYITIHETANKSAGADAHAHQRLQTRDTGRQDSWQWTVDDKYAVQSYPDETKCWHTGKRQGNHESIGIEICINSDGDIEQAYRNAAELTAMLIEKHDIPITRVVQHNFWSGKNCPTLLRDGSPLNWAKFIALVAAFLKGVTIPDEVPVPKPSTKPKANGKTAVDGYWGNDVTLELQHIFGTSEDGEVWRQNEKWKSENTGLTHGWKWGEYNPKGSPLLVAMVDKWIGSDYKGDKEDRGVLGPQFVKGLQRKLKSLGYYDKSIDGELWSESAAIKGLQRAINDGAIKLSK